MHREKNTSGLKQDNMTTGQVTIQNLIINAFLIFSKNKLNDCNFCHSSELSQKSVLQDLPGHWTPLNVYSSFEMCLDFLVQMQTIKGINTIVRMRQL